LLRSKAQAPYRIAFGEADWSSCESLSRGASINSGMIATVTQGPLRGFRGPLLAIDETIKAATIKLKVMSDFDDEEKDHPIQLPLQHVECRLDDDREEFASLTHRRALQALDAMSIAVSTVIFVPSLIAMKLLCCTTIPVDWFQKLSNRLLIWRTARR
jgi:hypothetical protein